MATSTLTIEADTAEAEARMERLVALAERFKELWGDVPIPDGIERFTIREGDRLVFRYDRPLSQEQTDKIQAQIHHALPEIEIEPLVLGDGLRLEGVLAPE